MWYPSETHLKSKSLEISFAHNYFSSITTVFDSAVLCAKLQNGWATEAGVIDEWDLQDLSLICVSDGYHMLHSRPGAPFTNMV